MSHVCLIDYPLKPCPYCDDMIPNTTRGGNKLELYRYNDRKACSKPDCLAQAKIAGNEREDSIMSNKCPICDKPKTPYFKCCSKECKIKYDIQRQQEEAKQADIQQQAADRFLLNKRIEA